MKCNAGWEILCPDGFVRDYPYHNRGNAESMADLSSKSIKKACRLYPKRSPIELALPPCPGGKHIVRAIVRN